MVWSGRHQFDHPGNRLRFKAISSSATHTRAQRDELEGQIPELAQFVLAAGVAALQSLRGIVLITAVTLCVDRDRELARFIRAVSQAVTPA